MRLQDKLEKILIEKQLKSSEFISKTGVSKTAFYAIRSGKTKKLSPENAKSISTTFPEYSYEWLMNDEISEDNFIGKNKKILVDEFVDVFFLYQEKIEANDRFKLYMESLKKNGIIEFQRNMIDTLNKEKK